MEFNLAFRGLNNIIKYSLSQIFIKHFINLKLVTTFETRYCCFSYMHFVLMCTVMVLYCFVVCVCACGHMSGFCNVCVCEGFVMCVYVRVLCVFVRV
jgi:hypothetical protein